MKGNKKRTILVVNDVEPTRKGIETLLARDGYHVEAASGEGDAANAARRRQPELLLVTLNGEIEDVIKSVCRIRERAALSENAPAIIFCVGELKEGDEINVGRNIHLSHPDNFNQLRFLISRLLQSETAAQN